MSIVAIRCKIHHRDQGLPLRVQQIALDSMGVRALRLLTAEGTKLIKGSWTQIARPLSPGLYCEQCLNEGKRTPLDIDTADLPDLDLADTPVLFVDPKRFQVDDCIADLRIAFPHHTPQVRELPAVPPHYASDDAINSLLPILQTALAEKILPPNGRLYAFQADALQAAQAGHDLVVTTPTASGKTLTYLLPVLDTLLRDANATALYLSPLVALTEDQMETLSSFDESGTDWQRKGNRFSHYRYCRQLSIGRQKLIVARYDGSVTPGDRQHIRQAKPRYLLTTPDMLHMALLNGAFEEKQWATFFSGLRYVVIDELHTYKGVFGASFANLMRRLLRICAAHNVSPQFICTSATIVDPAGTVEQLVGRRPSVVDGAGQGAPQQRRQFVLWSDGIGEDRRALNTVAKDLLLFALRHRIRTIAFGRSIGEINDIYRFTTAELRESGSTELKVSPFMRELKAEQKRQIIRDVKAGKVHAVISTTALSMGIDIGSLSAAMLIGFPGSIAALWQQAGRAGRAGEGLIVLIADSNPLDQFFVNHPDVLFDLQAEPVYINPDNPYVVRGHLLCAARELPLTQEEISAMNGISKSEVNALLAEGWLQESEDGSHLGLTEYADEIVASVPLRNLGFSIDVLTEDRTETIVQVDAARAQRALHKYAQYQHIDRYFLVTRFDVDFQRQQGKILVKELERPEFTTTAKVEREVEILTEKKIAKRDSYTAVFGHICSRTDVVGYYRVPLFSRNESFEYQPLGRAAPPPLEYNTHAFWLVLSETLLDAIPVSEREAGLYSLAEALRMATAIEELCDPSDLIAVSSLYHIQTGASIILLHDATPGGIGITEAAFGSLSNVLWRARQILEECPYCATHEESRGCPSCVTAQYGDESTINRRAGIKILHGLLTTI